MTESSYSKSRRLEDLRHQDRIDAFIGTLELVDFFNAGAHNTFWFVMRDVETEEQYGMLPYEYFQMTRIAALKDNKIYGLWGTRGRGGVYSLYLQADLSSNDPVVEPEITVYDHIRTKVDIQSRIWGLAHDKQHSMRDWQRIVGFQFLSALAKPHRAIHYLENIAAICVSAITAILANGGKRE